MSTSRLHILRNGSTIRMEPLQKTLEKFPCLMCDEMGYTCENCIDKTVIPELKKIKELVSALVEEQAIKEQKLGEILENRPKPEHLDSKALGLKHEIWLYRTKDVDECFEKLSKVLTQSPEERKEGMVRT